MTMRQLMNGRGLRNFFIINPILQNDPVEKNSLWGNHDEPC